MSVSVYLLRAMKQLSLARHLQFFQVLLNFYLRKGGSCHQQIDKNPEASNKNVCH